MDPNLNNTPQQNFGGVPSGPAPKSSSSKSRMYVLTSVALIVVAGLVSLIVFSGSDTRSSQSIEDIPESVSGLGENTVNPTELVATASQEAETARSVSQDQTLVPINIETATQEEIASQEESQVNAHDEAVESGALTLKAPIRFSGSNRYDTAAKVSELAFPNPRNIDKVVLVNGSSEIDMAIASSLANINTTILLVEKDRVPSETTDELLRIARATHRPDLIIVGGSGVISSSAQGIAQDNLSLTSSKVTRLDGANRFATAARVSKFRFPNDNSAEVAYLATANTYVDAMLASNRALSAPIILTNKNSTPKESLDEMCRLGIKSVIVVGGPAAVDTEALQSIQQYHDGTGPISRLPGYDCATPDFFRYKDLSDVVSGETRFETATAISKRNFFDNTGAAIIVNGFSAPDLLSAVVFSQGSGVNLPILLVNDSNYSSSTVRELKRMSATQLFVVGGENAINESNLRNLVCEQFNCSASSSSGPLQRQDTR